MEIITTIQERNVDIFGCVLMSVLAIALIGACITFIILYINDHDSYCIKMFIIYALLTALVIWALCNMTSTVEYTYARIPDTVSYKEVIEHWKYISNEGDIYKLVAR